MRRTRRTWRLLTLSLSMAAAVAVGGAAPDPSERLSDPANEARARHLMQAFRCVVCQNESIDDSEADLASDLRRIIREQVQAGRDDHQVRAFMVARYGDFILLKPPFNPGNAALWLTPAAILLLAGSSILLARRRRADEPLGLTEDEESRLAPVLADD